jgi:predicted aspartyl protease
MSPEIHVVKRSLSRPGEKFGDMPLLDVVISRGGVKHEGVKAVALIDTGADFTVITPDIVDKLGLLPAARRVPTVYPMLAGPQDLAIYPVHIYFDHLFFDVLAGGSVMREPMYQCLIGRDVLSFGTFGFDGLRKTFTLAFPMKP